MTAAPLWRCWGFSVRQGRVPKEEDIQRALDSTGFCQVKLQRETRTVLFKRPGIELNLGSIGKGYALDRAGTILKKAGIGDALLHAGHSSICAIGDDPAAREGWRVSIRHPLEKKQDFAVIRLRDQGMGTSGAGEQYFYWQGQKYGHVIDPRSGYPADTNLSATAIASTAAEADALATAFFVMRLEEIEDYCQKNPGVGAIVIPREDNADSLRCCTFGVASQDLEVYL